MEHKYSLNKMQNTCIAYGEFDGMHRGHLSIIQRLVRCAKAKGLISVLMSLYITKDKVLNTEEDKEYLLKDKIDVMISIEIKEILKLSEEDFIKKVLIDELGAKVIVIGRNYKLNLELLEELTKENNVEIIVCDAVFENRIVISSDMIRNYFAVNDFNNALKLSGHPYVMSGTVKHGKALGRTVGMPTANLEVTKNKAIPPNGVYATINYIMDKKYIGLTNIGPRPSVDDEDYITIETYLLDFNEDIYGDDIVVEVHNFIRDVQKFNNIEEVHEQVMRDLKVCERLLEKKS